MPNTFGRLSALAVERAERPGSYSDGGGLYLHITDAGVKSWIYRFQINYRIREMGLGPYTTVSLAEARERAFECRKMSNDGIDPLEARRRAKAEAALKVAKAMTFKQAAKAYLTSHEPSWQNPKHIEQWHSTLATYVEPILGHVRVGDIDTALVLKVIEPLWSTKTETASRVRGRIEAILNWASARGLRSPENPARWRGHLDKILPPKSRMRTVRHLPALPFNHVPDFFAALRERPAVAARALEFTILTAARSGEVIRARWNEMDLIAKVWTVPAERMKMRRLHRVPLSAPTIPILERIREIREPEYGDYVFPGSTRPTLSDMSMIMLLRRMGHGDELTTHGFRSSFRDWVSECTDFQGEVAEAALAHVIGDKVEAAYRRGDLFNKRRELMDAWGRYCESRLPEQKLDTSRCDPANVWTELPIGA